MAKKKRRIGNKKLLISLIALGVLAIVAIFVVSRISGNVIYNTSVGKTISVKLNDDVTFTCNSPSVTARINNLQRSSIVSQNNLQFTDLSTGKYYYATFTSNTVSSASGKININNIYYPVQITGGIAESEVYKNIIAISSPDTCSKTGTASWPAKSGKSSGSTCTASSECYSKNCKHTITRVLWFTRISPTGKCA